MTELCAQEEERWSLQVYEEHAHVFVQVRVCPWECACVCVLWVYCKITQGVPLKSPFVCLRASEVERARAKEKVA